MYFMLIAARVCVATYVCICKKWINFFLKLISYEREYVTHICVFIKFEYVQ